MKPAPFGYERPRDLPTALAVLGEVEGSAKIIAGGYPGDPSQAPGVLLENLACKASGALALKHLLRVTGLPADPVVGVETVTARHGLEDAFLGMVGEA